MISIIDGSCALTTFSSTYAIYNLFLTNTCTLERVCRFNKFSSISLFFILPLQDSHITEISCVQYHRSILKIGIAFSIGEKEAEARGKVRCLLDECLSNHLQRFCFQRPPYCLLQATQAPIHLWNISHGHVRLPCMLMKHAHEAWHGHSYRWPCHL